MYPAQQANQSKSPMLLVIGIILVTLAVASVIIVGLLYLPSLHPTSDNISPGTGKQGKTLDFTIWNDPTEGAFSVILPKSWAATGGVQRPYLEPNFIFTAKDSTGEMSVFFKADAYPWFVEPLPETDPTCSIPRSVGIRPDPYCIPGSWWTPLSGFGSIYVWPRLSPSEYVSQVILPDLKKSYPDAQLLSSYPRQDLAGQFASFLLSGQSDGGDALLSYTKGGVLYNEGVVVVVNEATIAGTNFTLWWVGISGASAPKADFSSGRNVASLYSTILPTTRVSLAWLKREAQNQQGQSKIIQETTNRIMQNDYRTFVETSESNVRTGQGWMDALGGTRNVWDPVKEQVRTVPSLSGADNWWVSPSGDIVATRLGDPDPAAPYVPMHDYTEP